MFQHSKQCPVPPDNISSLIPARKPTWAFSDEDPAKLKATWMGHASFYVELPARAGVRDATGLSTPTRGARILFDPVFSERCSPIQWAGFQRITRKLNHHCSTPPSDQGSTAPACSFEELPEIDVVVISVRDPTPPFFIFVLTRISMIIMISK